MKQHVCVEASLERKALVTLGTVERFLCVRSMDGLVGFELLQLGESFPAVFAAQRLLVLTLRSTSVGLELHNAFGSDSESQVTVIWIVWLQLTEKCTI